MTLMRSRDTVVSVRAIAGTCVGFLGLAPGKSCSAVEEELSVRKERFW